jgi:hypothetical protein
LTGGGGRGAEEGFEAVDGDVEALVEKVCTVVVGEFGSQGA